MTAKELVNIAFRGARTDLLYDLERHEQDELPVYQVYKNLVECFVEFALERLINLCTQYRKGHKGESERKIIIGENAFYIFKLTGTYTLVMDIPPEMISEIPL